MAWLAIAPGAALPAQQPVSPAAIQQDSALVRFLSDEMTRQLKALDVPGAVLTVVRNGRVVTNTAFGNASVTPPIPVIADSTTFRIASVSKVFTALAVLRLVEAGRLSLEADVRRLLTGLTIRGDIDAPLTLHQLLTHTAGFDDRLVGYLNPPGQAPEPLAEHLARALPARARVADDAPGYSNHGYALAGLVVERTTGVPFATYVRDSILAPLGMRDTRFVLGPSDSVGIGLAAEYRSTGERRVPRSSRPYPAGNLATTGADMGRFLIALSRALRGDSVPIISPAIARQLVGPMLQYHPQLPPMGYGLSGMPMHGRTVWMKGGASPSHSAVLAVMPDVDLGVFIAVNRQEPLVWNRVLAELVRHLGADSARVSSEPNEASTPAPLEGLAGTYLLTRAPVASNEKIVGLAVQSSVSVVPRGIEIEGLGEIAGTYFARDSLLFERNDGRRVAFRLGADGRATHFFAVVQGQPFSFERISVWSSAVVQLVGLALATLVGVVAAVVAARSSRGARTPPEWARAAIIALPIAELVTFVAALGLAREADALQSGPTILLRTAFAFAALTAIVAVAQVAAAATLATRPTTSRISRGVYVIGALSGVTVLWFLITNNLAYGS